MTVTPIQFSVHSISRTKDKSVSSDERVGLQEDFSQCICVAPSTTQPKTVDRQGVDAVGALKNLHCDTETRVGEGV